MLFDELASFSILIISSYFFRIPNNNKDVVIEFTDEIFFTSLIPSNEEL